MKLLPEYRMKIPPGKKRRSNAPSKVHQPPVACDRPRFSHFSSRCTARRLACQKVPAKTSADNNFASQIIRGAFRPRLLERFETPPFSATKYASQTLLATTGLGLPVMRDPVQGLFLRLPCPPNWYVLPPASADRPSKSKKQDENREHRKLTLVHPQYSPEIHKLQRL